METKDAAPPPTPRSARVSALMWIAAVIVFTALSWVEHFWRLSRGDYAGVGLAHTWYWHVTTWGAIAFLVGWLGLRLVRWSRS
jgi:hypothetical protein